MVSEVETKVVRPGLSMPGVLLRVEGLPVALAATGAYVYLGGPWWLFLVLLLAPDLSMVGYLANARTGSVTYNTVHNYLLPGALLAYGLLAGAETAALVALIWIAHIGMDRLLGYGLKYPTEFKDTHLGHV